MLKLSKKWSYALKAVIYIANPGLELVKIRNISENQAISETLLRRLIADLERTWILETIKWRSGWVRLWKKSFEISIYDILKAVWEELWISSCTRWIDCWNIDICLTTWLYSSLQKWFNSILKLHTLDKIVKNELKLNL